MRARRFVVRQVLLVLVPVGVVLAMVAIMSAQTHRLEESYESDSLRLTTSAAISALSLHLGENLRVYNTLRRWTLSGALLPIVPAVEEIPNNSPLDLTHSTFELGAYQLVLSHPYLVSVVFLDDKWFALEGTREAGAMYTTEYEQYLNSTHQRRRRKTLSWGSNYSSVTQGSWETHTQNPGNEDWYRLALSTRAPREFLWEGRVTNCSEGDGGDGALSRMISWTGPRWELLRKTAGGTNSWVSLARMSFRVDWPGNTGGRFAVFRVDTDLSVLDSVLSSVPLPSKDCVVALVSRDGRLLSAGNSGRSLKTYSEDAVNGTRTPLLAWQAGVPALRVLRPRDLTRVGGRTLERDGFVAQVTPLCINGDWSLVVSIRESDLLSSISALRAIAGVAAVVSVAALLVSVALSLGLIFRKIHQSRLREQRGVRLSDVPAASQQLSSDT